MQQTRKELEATFTKKVSKYRIGKNPAQYATSAQGEVFYMGRHRWLKIDPAFSGHKQIAHAARYALRKE